MSTGYTEQIKEGVTFPDFVMGCARAFGALIIMRDDPIDTEIPEFFPSIYNKESLGREKEELRRLESMSLEEASKQAVKEFDENVKRYTKHIREQIKLREKYFTMLYQVKAWEPPTSGHVGLKDFMVKQIEESIEHDCDLEYWKKEIPNYPKTGETWLREHKKMTLQSIAYHTKENRAEIDRTKERNDWVRELRNSLKG